MQVSTSVVHSKKIDPWQPQLVGWYERRPLQESIMVKFSSLSAPTKIEELTAGSDKKKKTAQPRRESNPGSCEFLSQALTTESVLFGRQERV